MIKTTMIKAEHFLFVILFTAFFLSESTYPVSVDQQFTLNAIESNAEFIKFTNIHITNFGTPENIEDFKKVIEYDYQANLFYLEGKYTLAHKTLLEGQKILRDILYELITEKYEKDTAFLLKITAPIVLNSKDQKAAYCLRKGYSYLAKSREFTQRGLNSNRFMHSLKIKMYIQALLHLHKAKRYAILSLVESKIPMVDKKEYRTQTLDEAMNLVEKVEISDYLDIRYQLQNLIFRKLLPTGVDYLLHHDDNYRKVSGDRPSILIEKTFELNNNGGATSVTIPGNSNQGTDNSTNGNPSNSPMNGQPDP